MNNIPAWRQGGPLGGPSRVAAFAGAVWLFAADVALAKPGKEPEVASDAFGWVIPIVIGIGVFMLLMALIVRASAGSGKSGPSSSSSFKLGGLLAGLFGGIGGW